MKRWVVLVLALVAVWFVGYGLTRPGAAQQAGPGATTTKAVDHAFFPPDQIVWKDGPASLEPGAKYAILEGDPTKEGFFAMRLMLPDGFKIAAHRHTNVERVTVICGTLNLGIGEKPDSAVTHVLPAGSYLSLRPGTTHFAWAKDETVLQITTLGPWQVAYVNPSDDPRKKN